MAEREVLDDAIGIGLVHLFAGAEVAAALGAFAAEQVAFAGAHAHDFAGAGDFKPFRHRFFRFNAFRPSHRVPFTSTSDVGFERARNIESWRVQGKS